MTDFDPAYLLNGAIFAALGLTLFAVAFAIMNKLLPCSLWKEIVEKQNTALAVLAGAITLGLSIIIAAAVH